MDNKEIARVFDEIVGMLELKGENVFKIRAYQKAASAIEHLPVELNTLHREGRLKEIPGVGEAIAKKIAELLETGKLDFYERLKEEFPPGVSALLEVPGIGPKTALLLAGRLRVTSVDDLEAAILEGKVAELPRMGAKAAENILGHIRSLRKKDHRIPLGEAQQTVEQLIKALSSVSEVRNLTPAGSLRRFCDTIGDIDLMGTAEDPEAVIAAFVSLSHIRMVLGRGTTKASAILSNGLQVDLRIVEHEAFGSLLQHFTGSKQHNVRLRERARRLGLSLSEYGITEIASGKLEKFATEEAFYGRQGLQYIPPEIREGGREIDLASTFSLPKLVEEGDIKGDLHVHTTWTDGSESVEGMVLAAKGRGYEYVCISDHSAGRGIARGMNVDRVNEQIDEISSLREKIDGIEILTGIEVDIRNDGTLDMPDDVLSKLDVVTASVHSGLGQDREHISRRIISAMENPNVDVLGHPTGRLTPKREPADVDMELIFQTARRTGTVIEINSMPNRLDLKDVHVQRAKEMGVMLAINTDSHSSNHYQFSRFGVGVARRGWCQRSDILNTRTVDGLKGYLRQRKSERTDGP